MSTIKANDIQNASGGIPTVKGQQLIPTAWVNFNGTGTVAIRDSENVSSITDNGTGDYSINFATAMANANYALTAGASNDAIGNTNNMINGYGYTTTLANIGNYNAASTLSDRSVVNAIILGGQA